MDDRGERGDRPRLADPLAGPDGTQPARREDDPTVARAADSDLRLPGVTDRAGVARWMDDDRERALRPLARDVPPPRPIPPQRVHRALPPEYTESPAPAADHDDEPAWRRERREEAEFRAQFGEWRAGAAGPARSGGGLGGLGGVKLGAPLILLIAVLIAVFALALHL
ncbi:hypothetical protein [Actinomycetospora termitidis]|uniref:Uncharacterized protein n=1 Tax=Actinomycetospora termitidis TaxID=3053470 RepID=A0ABT7M1E5_9PSEU|nr:hypothetical protein [Actinomycetospora sp. Odt1-22]MDL5154478.1 hypothetical protein [Actinomycetospora sp. Odt1-22]